MTSLTISKYDRYYDVTNYLTSTMTSLTISKYDRYYDVTNYL